MLHAEKRNKLVSKTKENKMRNFLVLTLLLSSFNAMAQSTKDVKGNGGDGVVIWNRVYLFDLYESGIQNLNLSEEVSKRVDVTTKVNQSLNAFSPFVRNIVANKIVALGKVDKALSEVLLHGFSMFSWRIVPFSLQDVADDDGTDIALGSTRLRVDLNVKTITTKTEQI